MSAEQPNGSDRQLELYMRQYGRLQRSVATLAIADTHFTDSQFLDTQQVAQVSLTAEIEPRPLLHREEFNQYAEAINLRAATASLFWNIGRTEETYQWWRMYPELPSHHISNRPEIGHNETLDLELIVGCMRTIECGDIRMSGFGQGSWDFYTTIINERMSDPETQQPLILPWQEGIHTKLRSWVPERRYEAAEQLEDLYKQTENAFLALTRR